MTSPINNDLSSLSSLDPDIEDVDLINPNALDLSKFEKGLTAKLNSMSFEQVTSLLHKTVVSSSHDFGSERPVEYLIDEKGITLFEENAKSSPKCRRGIFDKANVLTPTIEDSKELSALGDNPRTVLRKATGEEEEINITIGAPIEAEEMRKFERAYVLYITGTKILKTKEREENQSAKKEELPEAPTYKNTKHKEDDTKLKGNNLTKSKLKENTNNEKSNVILEEQISANLKKHMWKKASQEIDQFSEKILMYKFKEMLKNNILTFYQNAIEVKKDVATTKRNFTVASQGQLTQILVEENCTGKVDKVYKENASN